jgi:hypothetical protein
LRGDYNRIRVALPGKENTIQIMLRRVLLGYVLVGVVLVVVVFVVSLWIFPAWSKSSGSILVLAAADVVVVAGLLAAVRQAFEKSSASAALPQLPSTHRVTAENLKAGGDIHITQHIGDVVQTAQTVELSASQQAAQSLVEELKRTTGVLTEYLVAWGRSRARFDSANHPKNKAFSQSDSLPNLSPNPLGSYNYTEDTAAIVASYYKSAEILAGKLREFPAVTQAVRDFLNRADWLRYHKGRMGFATREESEQAVIELEERSRTVLQVCNVILNRDRGGIG